ncbi:glutamyl-tRNA reductase [Kouleothrix sp.]|uniref:glutamyl-tRNA reductase n=1 Tax=Kouleothrix sp. TaxID=2779161 RepID=UPI00391CAFB7
MTQFAIIGTHQRICPVAMREQLAISPADTQAALADLRAHAGEGFIISTCNRVEIGGLVADGQDASAALIAFLTERHHIPAEQLTAHLYAYSGPAAVRHLFRLAAGLDSMVLGEEQIQTQLKGALADAQAAGTAGQATTRLLQHALAVGKRVRTETGIARQHLSVVSVALDIAREQLGDLARRRVLLLGAGRTAELALKHLRGAHAEVTIVNRTAERARALADAYGASALPYGQLEPALAAADVAICCTAAPGYVVDASMVARASAGRAAGLLLLDLAVPRDIEPLAAQVPGVRLWDVDSLQVICEANRGAREAEVAHAERLVDGEIARFEEWWGTQHVVPTIRALRERAEHIRAAELERTLAKLAHLSPQEQAAIGALSAAIVNKLLHQPISALKDPHSGGQLAALVQELFQLGT